MLMALIEAAPGLIWLSWYLFIVMGAAGALVLMLISDTNPGAGWIGGLTLLGLLSVGVLELCVKLFALGAASAAVP